MNVLGIIPARGGSVGIPRKNLAVVAGKSLLQWAIDSAKGTRLSQLVVSTNDDEIVGEAYRLGTRVVLRPDELSQGEAVPGSSSTFRACRWHVEQMPDKPDAVMILQPTCPLRRPEDIDAAITVMESHPGCDMVVSYTPLPGVHFNRLAEIDDDGKVEIVEDYSQFAPRQALRPLYLRSGDIYLIRTNRLLSEQILTAMYRARAIIIPPERHLNIDTAADLERADRLLRAPA